MTVSDSEQQRARRATDLAYAQGVRDTEVDSRLDSHEKRLNAINGSMGRLADQFEALAAAMKTKAAIETDRNDQLKQANEKQISRRDYWLGVATICAMIIVGFYAKSKGIG